MSDIEWCDKTWNPIVGCDRISPGCDNCYAARMAYRLAAMSEGLEEKDKYPGRLAAYEGITERTEKGIDWTGEVALIPEALEIPLRRQKPTLWFLNSMSDLFHRSVDYGWFERIVRITELTPQHFYLVLTKRHLQARGVLDRRWRNDSRVLSNIGLGVSAENHGCAIARIPVLSEIDNVGLRFLSLEPLLGEIRLKEVRGIEKIDWVVVGGESGPGARRCRVEWIDRIVSDCRDLGIPVFVKQFGSNAIDDFVRLGTKGKGNKWDDPNFPDRLKIREFPERLQRFI